MNYLAFKFSTYILQPKFEKNKWKNCYHIFMVNNYCKYYKNCHATIYFNFLEHDTNHINESDMMIKLTNVLKSKR